MKVVLLFVFLYLFFVSIELLGAAFKLFGKGFAESVLRTTSHPLIGLFLGILATSVVQSSSATTSIVVGMVAASTNALPLSNAVPIIMGANIGTTVTNTIVAIGHITRPQEFRRAFAGATVHDFFNFLSVLVFLPLELTTHYLEKSAVALQKLFVNVGGLKFVSPLKMIVKPAVHFIRDSVLDLGIGKTAAAVICLIIALVLLFLALARIVQLMRSLIIGKVEALIHDYLFQNAFRSFIFGLLLTAFVQSSSMVTSLAVPLVGAGILSLEQVFPYTVGANIGTTFTAIMASFVTANPAAIATAFVHLLFNISGTILWLVLPLRKVPITLAKKLGELAYRKRSLAIAYVITVFYGVPLILYFLTK